MEWSFNENFLKSCRPLGESRGERERGNEKLGYADNLVNTGRIISKILLEFRIGNFAYPKCPAATPSLPSTHSHYEVERDPNEIWAYFRSIARINYIKSSLPLKETASAIPASFAMISETL